MIQSGKIGMRSDGDYDYKVFWLQCDNCHARYGYDDEILSFTKAVEYKKQIGFRSILRNGKWYELCPDCAKVKIM